MNNKHRSQAVASLAAPLAGRVLAVFVVGLMASTALAVEPAAKPADDAGTRIYDTGASSKDVDTSDAGRKDWVLLPEEKLDREFKGSAVLVNEFVMVILNPQWTGADVCAKTRDGWTSRAEFRALPAKGPKKAGNWVLKPVENTRAAVALRTTCPAADGKKVEFVCRLTTGLPAVELRPGEGAEGVRISAVVCWMVVPDYFGDDFVRPLAPDSSVRMPAENILVGRQSPGGGTLMTVWRPDPGRSCGIQLSATRATSTWEVPGATERPVWLALLESARWDWCLLRSRLGEPLKEKWPWKPPFPARWRMDFNAKDGRILSETTESSSAPAAPEGFDYGRLIYVLDRSRATPLDVFTPMDIMRNTLGVGPCQYVLDAEGLAGGEAATPAFVMEWVEKQLKKKKIDGDEVRERLKNMTAHVGRTHARIKKYAAFAEEVSVLLTAGTPAAKPPADEAAALEKLRATVADMKASAAAGLAATEAEKVTKPADEIAALVGKEDAAAKAAGPVAEVRAVGAAEDRALAKCRMATRWLRCQCLDIAEGDVAKKAPALAELAKKVEARAAEMLAGK